MVAGPHKYTQCTGFIKSRPQVWPVQTNKISVRRNGKLETTADASPLPEVFPAEHSWLWLRGTPLTQTYLNELLVKPPAYRNAYRNDWSYFPDGVKSLSLSLSTYSYLSFHSSVCWYLSTVQLDWIFKALWQLLNRYDPVAFNYHIM